MRVAEHFFTLTEAAEALGVERHSIWRWIKAGRLGKTQKVGGVVLIEKGRVEHLRKARLLAERNDEDD